MLALAMQQCSAIDLPARLKSFFADRATELAHHSLGDAQAGHWSLLTLAMLGVIKQNPAFALVYFSQITDPPDHPDFHTLYNDLVPLKKYLD